MSSKMVLDTVQNICKLSSHIKWADSLKITISKKILTSTYNCHINIAISIFFPLRWTATIWPTLKQFTSILTSVLSTFFSVLSVSSSCKLRTWEMYNFVLMLPFSSFMKWHCVIFGMALAFSKSALRSSRAARSYTSSSDIFVILIFLRLSTAISKSSRLLMRVCESSVSD